MSVHIEETDHVCGAQDAPVQIVEYGDYQCPFTARAHAALVDLERRSPGRLRLAFRHLPLSDEHAFAELAAEAAEAAAAQGKFWQMHAALLENQDELSPGMLDELADEIGMDVRQFSQDMEERKYRQRVMDDVAQAHKLDAHGTPTFFINGERYHGDSDEASLATAFNRAGS